MNINAINKTGEKKGPIEVVEVVEGAEGKELVTNSGSPRNDEML